MFGNRLPDSATVSMSPSEVRNLSRGKMKTVMGFAIVGCIVGIGLADHSASSAPNQPTTQTCTTAPATVR